MHQYGIFDHTSRTFGNENKTEDRKPVIHFELYKKTNVDYKVKQKLH